MAKDNATLLEEIRRVLQELLARLPDGAAELHEEPSADPLGPVDLVVLNDRS